MAQQRSQNTVLVAGGLALVSLGVLAYTLTRPTKEKKKSTAKRSSSSSNDKGPKLPKFTKEFRSKPFDIHLVMSTEEGFHALVAADKKNEAQKLKVGARLIKIDDAKVEKWSYEDIYRKLMSAKVPVTLVFREEPELERQWNEAETLKEEGNEHYKKGNVKSGIEYLSKAIALHPTNKVYYSNRVLMYLKTKEYDKALEDCQHIRELDPVSRYIKGHYLRGLVLFNMKKYKNAASAFQTVIKINPNFKEAIKRLDDCKAFIDREQAAKNEQRRRNSEKFVALANANAKNAEENKNNAKNEESKNKEDDEEENNEKDTGLKEDEQDIENNEQDMNEIKDEEHNEDAKVQEKSEEAVGQSTEVKNESEKENQNQNQNQNQNTTTDNQSGAQEATNEPANTSSEKS